MNVVANRNIGYKGIKYGNIAIDKSRISTFYHHNINLIMSNIRRLSGDGSETLSQIPGLDLNRVFDLLPGYISIQDPDLRIVFANQNFKRDFGDVIGKLCYTVYKGLNDVCPSCPLKLSFQDKRIPIREETVQLLSGNICQMLVQTSPILDEHGEMVAVIDLSINISKVKADKKELVTLGQSIALLSHGIKNILEGLEGGVYVVEEGLKDSDLELVERGWNIVNKNIFAITDFVKNVLYTSKTRPLKYDFVSPGQLIKDSLALFREKAAALRIRLRHQSNPYLPDVRLDIASARRMLNNLIWNAIEACLHDKKKKRHFVSLKTDYYDDDHFMFEIKDNGIGMDEATKQKIFEEFYSTKGTMGTGLGLAVVEKIVNKHGGRIEVTSTPGKGTRFKIIFKIKQAS
jgi:signal transduction histidine kinase